MLQIGSEFQLPMYLDFCKMPVAFAIQFYINYFLLIPNCMFKERNTVFYGINVVTCIVLAIALSNVHFIEYLPPLGPEMARPPIASVILKDMAYLVFATGLAVVVRLSMRWNDAENARREAVKSMTETELKNLRSQLNPHFLLNTLNNIYALIAFDTEKAQQAVQELSKLLRYVLYDNQQMFVPLKKEVDFIGNYIELMRIRMSSNVDIVTNFDIKPDSQTPIAPLIFISLIENAFKHGISPTERSFITISIVESTDTICCTISNSYYPKTATDKSGSGIGLEQVQKRLNLVYPKAYEWDKHVSDDQKEYVSTITIYLNRNTKNEPT